MDEEREGREGEQVMSEVHLGCPPRFAGPYVSRFTFALPRAHNFKISYEERHASSSQKLSLGDVGDHALTSRGSLVEAHAQCDNQLIQQVPHHALSLDDDGDLVLTRRRSNCIRLRSGFTIQHSITSSLHDVGLQVWRAALVLTDFILHKSFTSSDLNDIIGIELGAGTGLVGIALARVARAVFITDRSADILDNCETNIHLNSSLLKLNGTSVRVRELNWKDSWPPFTETSDFSSYDRSRYSWASSEIEEAESSRLLLAADVIYSDVLTDLFFDIVEKLMSRGSEKVLYLALEKRYNFSLDDLDVVANGYAHFQSFLKNGGGCIDHDDAKLPCFQGEQIDISQIPQYIKEYERGKDLELWKITVSAGRNKHV